MLAVEAERALRAEQSLDYLDRLLKPVDADGGVVVDHPGLVVVGAHPAGSEAELEAAVAEHVERGCLLGQHDGVAVVVSEDERTDAQRGRRRGRGGEGRHRSELVAEVIGHEQGGVPEVLDLARLLRPRPRRAVGRGAELGGEAERVERAMAPSCLTRRRPCSPRRRLGQGEGIGRVAAVRRQRHARAQ